MKLGGGSKICECCGKSVYKLEELQVDKAILHKSCFKCAHCNRQLTLSNFAAVSNKLYCKTHFVELFHSAGGKYSVFGGDSFKMKESGSFAVKPVTSKFAQASSARATNAAPEPILETPAQSPSPEPTSKPASSSMLPSKLSSSSTSSKAKTTLPSALSKASSAIKEEPKKAEPKDEEPITLSSSSGSVFKADDSCREGSPEKKEGKYLSLKERLQMYQRVASHSGDDEEDQDKPQRPSSSASGASSPRHNVEEITPPVAPSSSSSLAAATRKNSPTSSATSSFSSQGLLPSKLGIPSDCSVAEGNEEDEDDSGMVDEDEDEDDVLEDMDSLQPQLSLDASSTLRLDGASTSLTSPTCSRNTSMSDVISENTMNDPACEDEDDAPALRRQLSKTKEAMRLLQLHADSLQEENDRLVELTIHLKKELAVQTAKALESDEWCAKLSRDLQAAKVTAHE